jgi:glycerol-3-phosphate cytidylyltransferase-like family protein
MLFEPFAGAQIEDGGGEEEDRGYGENGVVHKQENRARVLRKCSVVDKEVVSEREKRSNEAMR